MGNIGKVTNHIIMEPLDVTEAPAEPEVRPAAGWINEHVEADAQARETASL